MFFCKTAECLPNKELKQSARLLKAVLSGKQVTLDESEPEFSCYGLIFFTYAQITSCDVQLHFSHYKPILRDNHG